MKKSRTTKKLKRKRIKVEREHDREGIESILEWNNWKPLRAIWVAAKKQMQVELSGAKAFPNHPLTPHTYTVTLTPIHVSGWVAGKKLSFGTTAVAVAATLKAKSQQRLRCHVHRCFGHYFGLSFAFTVDYLIRWWIIATRKASGYTVKRTSREKFGFWSDYSHAILRNCPKIQGKYILIKFIIYCW